MRARYWHIALLFIASGFGFCEVDKSIVITAGEQFEKLYAAKQSLASNAEKLAAFEDSYRVIVGTPEEKLVAMLAYYAADVQAKHASGLEYTIDRENFARGIFRLCQERCTDKTSLWDRLITQFDSEDPVFLHEVAGVLLSSARRGNGERWADFQEYLGGKNAFEWADFATYWFKNEALTALSVVARSQPTLSPEQIEWLELSRQLWSHLESQELKQSGESKTPPKVDVMLGSLISRDEWWFRLFALSVALKYEIQMSKSEVTRLRQDPHPAVQALAEMQHVEDKESSSTSEGL